MTTDNQFKLKELSEDAPLDVLNVEASQETEGTLLLRIGSSRAVRLEMDRDNVRIHAFNSTKDAPMTLDVPVDGDIRVDRNEYDLEGDITPVSPWAIRVPEYRHGQEYGGLIDAAGTLYQGPYHAENKGPFTLSDERVPHSKAINVELSQSHDDLLVVRIGESRIVALDLVVSHVRVQAFNATREVPLILEVPAEGGIQIDRFLHDIYTLGPVSEDHSPTEDFALPTP